VSPTLILINAYVFRRTILVYIESNVQVMCRQCAGDVQETRRLFGDLLVHAPTHCSCQFTPPLITLISVFLPFLMSVTCPTSPISSRLSLPSRLYFAVPPLLPSEAQRPQHDTLAAHKKTHLERRSISNSAKTLIPTLALSEATRLRQYARD
jgi:hypothetical protein